MRSRDKLSPGEPEPTAPAQPKKPPQVLWTVKDQAPVTSVALTGDGRLAIYFSERSKGTKTTRYLRALEVATGKLA